MYFHFVNFVSTLCSVALVITEDMSTESGKTNEWKLKSVIVKIRSGEAKSKQEIQLQFLYLQLQTDRTGLRDA